MAIPRNPSRTGNRLRKSMCMAQSTVFRSPFNLGVPDMTFGSKDRLRSPLGEDWIRCLISCPETIGCDGSTDDKSSALTRSRVARLHEQRSPGFRGLSHEGGPNALNIHPIDGLTGRNAPVDRHPTFDKRCLAHFAHDRARRVSLKK